MNLQQLINDLMIDTLDVSLPAFAPELVLCVTIVAMLLVRLVPQGAPAWLRRLNTFTIGLPGAAIALFLAAPWTHLAGGSNMRAELFTGMLVYDELGVYFRSVLLLFVVLFFIFTRLSGIPDRDDSPDIYSLVLGGTLGMCLMVSANHLLIVFLGVEMASVPSYVLAGLMKGRRKSSEAALKYVVYGAGTAGVMLYGISLLAGALGTVHLPTMAEQLTELAARGEFAERQIVLLLGGLFVMVGLAFKLSAVPFHFWCPDVFEGACAEVNAFLSVASKAAALALLVRVALGLADIPDPQLPVAAAPAVTQLAAFQPGGGMAPAPEGAGAAKEGEIARANVIQARTGVRNVIVGLIGLLAVVTATFGNLTAYAQTNIKRLLAYSTIAHAGIMMMPVAAAVALLDTDRELAEEAIAALAFYVGAYLFMNLGAFAIVAFLRNEMRTEEVADYAGLIRRRPGVVICMSIIMFSLIGMPPLSGFFAKFYVFSATWQAGLGTLLVVGLLNTVVSLFYYLRVIKVMALDPEPADRLPVYSSAVAPAWVFVVLVTLPVVVLGIWVDPLNTWVQNAAEHLLT